MKILIFNFIFKEGIIVESIKVFAARSWKEWPSCHCVTASDTASACDYSPTEPDTRAAGRTTACTDRAILRQRQAEIIRDNFLTIYGVKESGFVFLIEPN